MGEDRLGGIDSSSLHYFSQARATIGRGGRMAILDSKDQPNYVRLVVIKSQYEGGKYGLALIADDGRKRQIGRDDFETPDDAIKRLEKVLADAIGSRPHQA
jgi:hypothetical protein